MTTPRLTLPWLDRYQVRAPNVRWVAILLTGAILAALGGLSLIATVVLMIAQMFFIVFMSAFLILSIVIGVSMARKAADS
ncbi:MAG: hypothetical protein V4503_09575 [Gemmatimonadota bacterium]